MGKTVEAEYIADEKVLRLSAPLEGVEDHAKVEVEIRQTPAGQSWMKLAGSLDRENGLVVARAIREAFGRDEIEV